MARGDYGIRGNQQKLAEAEQRSALEINRTVERVGHFRRLRAHYGSRELIEAVKIIKKELANE